MGKIDLLNVGIELLGSVIVILITTYFTHIVTKRQLNEQHNNEIKKINKQLIQTYTNERKSKYNDLQIQNLVELHGILSKSATSINFTVNSHCEYFQKILDGNLQANENNWKSHIDQLMSEEIGRTNFLPQITKRLILIPNFKKEFTEEEIEINRKKYNYISLDMVIKVTRRDILYMISSEDNTLTQKDIEEYKAFSRNYYTLITQLNKKIENKITAIQNEDMNESN
ncbi:hypothetical protein MTW84_00555 [Mammaliicoccus sciuri]|uniref:hypothetical protein n=1 Tax=Mammaliicoccus sciuri TaxID=1296 RepID=UPI001FB4A749|nr:hypothetical protein [Mammaliicoccus sciuri]MCJ0907683.1 hypothetical protein [Mammaliicoccus sciuri]